MIDFELDIFNKAYTEVSTYYPSALVLNQKALVPAEFPCVAIYESNNVTSARLNDSSLSENGSDITYVVDVCSNKRVGAKTECKGILSKVDSVMCSLNFTRVAMVSTTPSDNSMFYRITARYNATVDASGKLYRR